MSLLLILWVKSGVFFFTTRSVIIVIPGGFFCLIICSDYIFVVCYGLFFFIFLIFIGVLGYSLIINPHYMRRFIIGKKEPFELFSILLSLCLL